MEKNYDLLFKDAFNKKKDLTEFAESFSEGDNLLKKTLLNLWNNNISTFACCKGHETSEYYIPAYLAIEIDQYSIGLIKSVYEKLFPELEDISFNIGNINEGGLAAFTIYMRGNTKVQTFNIINQYASIKFNQNSKIIDNSLYMLEFSQSLSLKFDIEINKDNVYITFRNKNDNTKNLDFKPLEECITSLYNIKDVSHLFIVCKKDDLDKIIEILKQNKKN